MLTELGGCDHGRGPLPELVAVPSFLQSCFGGHMMLWYSKTRITGLFANIFRNSRIQSCNHPSYTCLFEPLLLSGQGAGLATGDIEMLPTSYTRILLCILGYILSRYLEV